VISGGGGGSTNPSGESFFTRVNEPPQDDYGLGNELKDLSGVVRNNSFFFVCFNIFVFIVYHLLQQNQFIDLL
jgi:hypothetical protein